MFRLTMRRFACAAGATRTRVCIAVRLQAGLLRLAGVRAGAEGEQAALQRVRGALQQAEAALGAIFPGGSSQLVSSDALPQ